jgi:hypothetical protein
MLWPTFLLHARLLRYLNLLLLLLSLNLLTKSHLFSFFFFFFSTSWFYTLHRSHNASSILQPRALSIRLPAAASAFTVALWPHLFSLLTLGDLVFFAPVLEDCLVLWCEEWEIKTKHLKHTARQKLQSACQCFILFGIFVVKHYRSSINHQKFAMTTLKWDSRCANSSLFFWIVK